MLDFVSVRTKSSIACCMVRTPLITAQPIHVFIQIDVPKRFEWVVFAEENSMFKADNMRT